MFIDTVPSNTSSSSSSSHSHQPAHRSHHSCVLCNQCRANWSTLTDRVRASNRAAGLPVTTTTSVLARCAGCSAVYYCSKQCQRMNWPIHKTLCREIQAMHERLKTEPSLEPAIRIISSDIALTIATTSSNTSTPTQSSSTQTAITTFTHPIPSAQVVQQSIRALHPPIQLASSQSSPQLNQHQNRTNEHVNRYVLPRIELYSVIEVHFILKVSSGEVIARSFTSSPSFLIAQANAADAQSQGVTYSRNELNDLMPTHAQFIVTELESDQRTIKSVEPNTIPGLIMCIQHCINKASSQQQQQQTDANDNNNNNNNQSNRTFAIIPPDLGYGESGIPDKVPPKSFIIAECEVYSIQPSPSRAQLLLKSVLSCVNQPMFSDDAIQNRIAAAGVERAQLQQQQQLDGNTNEMND